MSRARLSVSNIYLKIILCHCIIIINRFVARTHTLTYAQHPMSMRTRSHMAKARARSHATSRINAEHGQSSVSSTPFERRAASHPSKMKRAARPSCSGKCCQHMRRQEKDGHHSTSSSLPAMRETIDERQMMIGKRRTAFVRCRSAGYGLSRAECMTHRLFAWIQLIQKAARSAAVSTFRAVLSAQKCHFCHSLSHFPMICSGRHRPSWPRRSR